MTTFTFTAPDGRTHEVTGPDGATEAQAFSILQQRLGSVEPEAPKRPETSLGERIGSGFMDPFVGAGQLMERTGLPGAIRKGLGIESSMDDVVRQRDKDYVAPEGIDWARMAGNMANPVSWAGGGAGLGRAVGAGAIQAGLAPVDPDQDFATQKAKQMALGGAAGGALSVALPRALGGAIKPTSEAAALQRQGITLTPGQAAGGALNAIEQRATSWPVVGDVIAGARRRSLEDVQGKAVERATGIPGTRSVTEANEAVSGLYREAVPHIQPNPEGLFGAAEALNKALQNPELTPQHAKTLQGIFDNNFSSYADLDGAGLKKLDSQLGHLARKREGFTASPDDKVLAEEIRSIQQAMREGWEKGMAPQHSETLAHANRAYRGMVPINTTASARADELVTPRALQKALAKQHGTDVSRMADDALLDPAVKVLGSTVPDSGTAGRLGQGLAGGAVVAEPVSTLAAAAGGWAGAKVLYSRSGSNILTGNTKLQRELARAAPATRKALVAALRARQSAHEEEE